MPRFRTSAAMLAAMLSACGGPAIGSAAANLDELARTRLPHCPTASVDVSRWRPATVGRVTVAVPDGLAPERAAGDSSASWREGTRRLSLVVGPRPPARAAVGSPVVGHAPPVEHCAVEAQGRRGAVRLYPPDRNRLRRVTVVWPSDETWGPRVELAYEAEGRTAREVGLVLARSVRFASP